VHGETRPYKYIDMGEIMKELELLWIKKRGAMKAVMLAVNLIRSHRLKHRPFALCRKMIINVGMTCAVQKSDN
jgi:hypothetical protein